MNRNICAVALVFLALASARAEEATKNPYAVTPAPSARPNRWTVPPVEMEKQRLKSSEAETQRLECARLAVSANLAERQQAQVLCGGGTGLALLPPPPKPAPAPASPSPVTTCDPGGCWDISGSRYNGSGTTMIRSDGKVCQQIGTMMHCN